MSISADNKRFLKTILYLAPPIVLQEILNTSVNLLDTIMIGKLGANEIAAVGLGNQVFFLFIIVLFGITSGSSIFIGQFWGKEDKKSVLKTMGIGYTLNAFVAICFTCVALFIPDKVMGIYSENPAVIALGADYLRVICFSYIITSVIVTRNSALRATGQTRMPMITTFVALITNLVCNYITIFILDMGVVGAAISTVLARALECIVQHILIHRFRLPIIGKFKEFFSANKVFIAAFFKVTTFVIMNEAVWALGTSIYNAAYKYCGTESQAALQIGNTIMQIFQVFGMAIGTSCAIMLSNNLGAGEVERAISYSRKCLKMVLGISIVMACLLLVFAPFIIGFYDNLPENIIGLTYKLLFVIAFAMIPKTINYTSICGILRSGGDTKFCFWVDSLSVWLVGVPLGFLGAKFLHLPIYWVVLMTFCEEFAKFVFALRRVLSNVWAKTLV